MGSVVTFAICNITVLHHWHFCNCGHDNFSHIGVQACLKCNLYQLLISYCHEIGQYHMQSAGVFYMLRVRTVH